MSQIVVIQFTPGEMRALMHRLVQGDCIAEVFDDTEGMQHLANGAHSCADALAYQLTACNGSIAVRVDNELEREVLCEAVEGSTWPAVHHPDNDADNTHQGHTSAYRCLYNAACKIAEAFGLDVEDLELPQA